jgi:hypothetical protein
MGSLRDRPGIKSPSPGTHPVPKLWLRLIVRFMLTNVVLARVCKLCGQVFEVDYKTGRPREYCWTCEPAGWRVVLPKHRFGRVKLRRLRPYRV